ncbi:hypothetical protein L596_002507 [Steinernema carpocapsae]|uniref:Uncharacterized protein n=1 Tax=Steinernema carpocapsae TaxID=34508 RepID=A0A4U8UR92_STECR|nr:hypothetical protein L596_002507 [Steinernema carpocapsae]
MCRTAQLGHQENTSKVPRLRPHPRRLRLHVGRLHKVHQLLPHEPPSRDGQQSGYLRHPRQHRHESPLHPKLQKDTQKAQEVSTSHSLYLVCHKR